MEPRYFYGINPKYKAYQMPAPQFYLWMAGFFGITWVWWRYIKLEDWHPYYEKPVKGVDEYWMEHQRARMWRMPVPEMGGRTVTLDPISRGLPGWALSLDDLEPTQPDTGAEEENEEE